MNNTMKYKDYIGSVEFSEEAQCFYGTVLGIRRSISYTGKDAHTLVCRFHDAVDAYLAACASAGTEPERAYKGTFNVRVSEKLHREAAVYGMNHNMSLNRVVEHALQNMVDGEYGLPAALVREDTFLGAYGKPQKDDRGCRQEILAGESKNVEFKVERPKDSLKYMKTVVAFANGNGGKIFFGIDDKTRKVVGIPKSEIFSEMDAITAAISDSCEPTIIPDVYLQTVEDKTVIVAEIDPGRRRPYYIKSKGIAEGTYIRVAGTSRPAGRELTAEMYYEDEQRSYDCVIRKDLTVTDEEIRALCEQMKQAAIDHAETKAQKNAVKTVTKNQLLSWGLLTEDADGTVHPTNGYIFLRGKDEFLSQIQCGMFKGTTRAVFVDKREYTGPLWQQIEDAFQFVLRNIRLGAKLDGIYRRDIYELPPDSIRELIINAVMNCSFLQSSHVQVAIYDDRLEITSPGGLMPGVTTERMKEGYSKIRNRALAHAFLYMNMIEAWGSGIPKLMQSMQEYGLDEPEFIDMGIGLRINLYRKSVSPTVNRPSTDQPTDQTDQTDQTADQAIQDAAKTDQTKVQLTEEERQLLDFLAAHSDITQKELAERLGWTLARVKYHTAKLKERHLIERQGSNQKGKWIIQNQ